MNSLIKIPMKNKSSSILLEFNITIQNSVFDQINTCGSIISNAEDLNIQNGITQS